MLGKLIPYFCINQIQLLLMLLMGTYIVPLAGGEELVIDGGWGGLVLMSVATSICALGFALLIATLAKTPEQATTLGGTAIILLAAIGGVMVPTFVMPGIHANARKSITDVMGAGGLSGRSAAASRNHRVVT